MALAVEPEELFSGSWTKKNYSVAGAWSIVADGTDRFVVLDEEFATRRAPDLKVFLSPLPLDALSDGNATSGSFRIAKLEKHKGSQRFSIPAEVNLEDFKSLLIHCEKYSKLWAGAKLNSPQQLREDE